MAGESKKQITVELCGFNIAANPHPIGIYEKLIRMIEQKNLRVGYHGKKHAGFSDLKFLPTGVPIGSADLVLGSINIFTELDLKHGSWINRDSKLVADKNQREELAGNIGSWRPSNPPIRFLFDATSHIMIMEHVRFLSIKSAVRLLSRMFNDPCLKDENESRYVGVTAIPDERTVEHILSLSHLTKLTILLKRDNGDEVDTQSSFRASLNKYRAKKGLLTLWAEPEKSLALDPYLEDAVRDSSRNGSTEAKGEQAGEHIKLSTQNAPKIIRQIFDPESVNLDQVMYESIARFRLGL